jgi:hypothetical protein
MTFDANTFKTTADVRHLILRHLYHVLQTTQQSVGELVDVHDVGEYQLDFDRIRTQFDYFLAGTHSFRRNRSGQVSGDSPKYLDEHVKLLYVRLLGSNQFPDHLLVGETRPRSGRHHQRLGRQARSPTFVLIEHVHEGLKTKAGRKRKTQGRDRRQR